MNKVWSGYIEWEGWINFANAYILPPGRRTIWAGDEGNDLPAEPFFLSFPHLMFLCVIDAKQISCNLLPSAEFTTEETLLYPFPIHNIGKNGHVCLGDVNDITFANDNELIDYFFSSPFEPKSISKIKFKNRTISTLREWAKESKKDPNFGTSIHLEDGRLAGNAAWCLKDLIVDRPKFVVGQRVYYPYPGSGKQTVGIIESCWRNSVGIRFYYLKNGPGARLWHGASEDQLTEVPE